MAYFEILNDGRYGIQKIKKVVIKIKDSDSLRFLDFRYFSVRPTCKVNEINYISEEDLYIFDMI